jgi:transposase
MVNHVRGVIKSMGRRIPKCSARSFHFKAAEEDFPADLKAILKPVLEMIEQVSGKIRQYDQQIETMSKERYPQTKLLRQVSGVGPLTAMGYVLVVEDPGRFKQSRTLGAYLGLRPRQSQSGDRDPQLRITKAGDEFLRRLLVGSAQYIMGPFGPDSDLRRWGLALAGRGGKNAKKRAIVAVARKLAVLLHRLWVTGAIYQPLRKEEKIPA